MHNTFPPGFYGEPISAEAELRQQRFLAHKQRCRALPPVTSNEAEQLVAQFLAKRGSVTRCPPAYVAPVQ